MRVKMEEDDAVEVQMAPLIDCVFLLLIFFLVATTLKKIEKQLPLQLPVSAAAVGVQAQEDMLIIGVDQKGQAYLGANPVTIGLLHDRLRQAAQENPNQRVRVDADRDAPFQHVMRVLDMCEFEGLRNVGFHTKAAKSPY